MIIKKIVEVPYDYYLVGEMETLGQQICDKAEEEKIYLPNKKIIITVEIID